MNLQILFNASLAIQVHVYAAVLAFLLGAMVLWRRKGTATHKRWGKIWVGLMVITALTSFLIHEIRLWGYFSPIHLISVGTLVVLWLGVVQARKGKVEDHQRSMKGVYIGGLGIAGALSFMPGRRMYDISIKPISDALFGSNAVSGSDNMNIMVTFAGLIVAILIVNRKSLFKKISKQNPDD